MYTVPIINPDLRHEETIIQAARALNCLQQTIDHVFQQIDARIATNSKRVQNLDVRIEKAQQRICSLVGVKKSVQIYAPARFPATDVLCDIPLTNFQMAKKEQKQSEEDLNVNLKKYDVQSRVDALNAQIMQDKLTFFHVSTSHSINEVKGGNLLTEQIAAARQKLNCSNNSLGQPADQLCSTASLLRFNTEEAAYCNEISIQLQTKKAKSWRHAKKQRPPQLNQQKLLEPAPHSLANRNQRATLAGELRYTPKMHEAPIIDLPMDLPMLPGVAEDIHFTGAMATSTQPKVCDIKVDKQMAEQSLGSSQEKDANKPKELDSSVISVTEQLATPTPPPPPPPPPPATTTPTTPTKLPKEKSNNNVVQSDSRSALMDAIREAGGTRGGRLRAAAAAPIDTVDTKAHKEAGNLMDDLHNKLLMRRKGISGAKAVGNENNMPVDKLMGSNPVLQRLSALIPPPPTKNTTTQQKQQLQHQPSSSDVEDDDDWQ